MAFFRCLVHLRGQLRGINLDGSGNPVPNASQGDLFSYRLDYETAGFYNGNIGKQYWQASTNNAPAGIRSYTFTYDAASRLKSASYTGIGSESYGLPTINYDKNGNITALQRNGKLTSTFGLMDNLTYTYSGNRLMRVEDAVTGDYSVDFVNRNSGSDDYSYYANGALKSDKNEDINDILYSTYANQPVEIQLTSSRWIKNLYDGKGRLYKTSYSTGEYWEYLDGLVFKNGALYQLTTPEGRAVYQSGAWSYEYFHTDHLGNTRVAYKANGTALTKTSETSFDPWGVVLNGINQINSYQNRFEFLNREKESTFNLNFIRLGARGYNPTIGRFDRTDPVIEGQEFLSNYHYSFNNPVRFSDPDGLMGTDCCQSVVDFFAGATLTFIDNNSPVPSKLDGGGYRGSAYETGRKVGNALSILSGGVQVVAGALGTLGAGGAELVTLGGATPIALPAGAAAVATATNGAATISKAVSNLNAQGKSNSGGNKKSNVSSGNKNSAHANQKAKEAAKERYEKVKAEYDATKSKSNKTPEDKALEKKLDKQLKHEKQKMDETGENHSRKAKGSN